MFSHCGGVGGCFSGAYTDDDTDIEFVTLHALETHGLDLNYKQIAGYWKSFVHIRVHGGDALWFANKVARENMNRGQLPPQTGSQSNNRCWEPHWWNFCADFCWSVSRNANISSDKA